jgi:hypothetical protein
MALTLDSIVPWGRSFEEYRQIFALSDPDLERRILGCADGPAAFNAVLTQRGGRVISVDPLYAFTGEQIRDRIAATYDVILAQLRLNYDDYVWEAIPSVEALGEMRMAAMEVFLADYERGKAAGRYLAESLPKLPFERDRFDLALVSHFLFLYDIHLSEAFHWQALQALLQVAKEVRVFPLVSLNCQPSPYLTTLQNRLTQAGYDWELQTVSYEFQRGGNQMMLIRRNS